MKLKKLNDDPNIHGIIVQMPLDCDNKIDSHLITDSVSPDKDVDGCVPIIYDYLYTVRSVVYLNPYFSG